MGVPRQKSRYAASRGIRSVARPSAPMFLNADFSKRVVIRPADYAWVASPMPGVERMMLDRVGEEVARATSLVRYAPDSRFSPHVHDGGEEFFVLEGEFGDEHALYPEGTYVRNPIGSKHSPRVGKSGCVIFVKLHQFDGSDRRPVVIDTRHAGWLPGLVPGLEVMSLHEHEGEHVALVRWAPNTTFQAHTHWGGEEILVLEGTFFDEHGEYPAGSWLRNPHMSQHTPYTRDDGALIYVKVGHLG
jgi:anti-sigma factor ChrR (cupin superfamily)